MININTKILEKVDMYEYWVLTHIVKRMQAFKLKAWPSYQTIADDCGISKRKVIYTVESLVEKGLITVVKTRKESGLNTSNIYKLNTKLLGIFMSGEDIGELPEQSGAPDALYGAHDAISGAPDAPECISNGIILTKEESAREEKEIFKPHDIGVTPKEQWDNVKMKAFDVQYWGEQLIVEFFPDIKLPCTTYGKEWLQIYSKLLKWGQTENKGKVVTLKYAIRNLSTTLKYMSQYHKDNFTIPYLARKFDEILPESRNNKNKLSKPKETYHPTGGAVWEDPKNYNPRG